LDSERCKRSASARLTLVLCAGAASARLTLVICAGAASARLTLVLRAGAASFVSESSMAMAAFLRHGHCCSCFTSAADWSMLLSSPRLMLPSWFESIASKM